MCCGIIRGQRMRRNLSIDARGIAGAALMLFVGISAAADRVAGRIEG
jgi:hypothetical protein